MTDDIEYTDPQPEPAPEPGPQPKPEQSPPPESAPPTWQGDKKNKHSAGKKMLVASGFLAMVALMLIIWIVLQKKEQVNQQIGKAGVVTTEETLGARKEGLNLPVAREAEAGESSPDTTLEFPLEWGESLVWLEGMKDPEKSSNPKVVQAARDLDAQKKTLDAKYKAIATKFRKPDEEKIIEHPVTLKMDRELIYVLTQMNLSFSRS